MTSEISTRAACLAELISNPKSFFNCPDLHGGSGLPGDRRLEMEDRSGGKKQTAQAARLKINRRRRAAVF
jgi:hypothetical protein